MTQVKMQTNHGDFVIQLETEKAPETTKNFLNYVNAHFYDNTLFHRVINGFMIQGGGFAPGMQEKPTEAPIKNEGSNGLTNQIGTIAMARTPDPHSASSQFFINVGDNKFLNYTAPTAQGFGYCVFGQVIEGMEVINKIKTVKTGNSGHHQDVPVEDVIIISASVI